MRILIPVVQGKVSGHFGHCEKFAVFEGDAGAGTVEPVSELTPPEHVPGLLPRWLIAQGADVLLCGGIGRRALDLLREGGVEVVSGLGPEPPEAAAAAYVRGELAAAAGGVCGHEHGPGAGNCRH